MIFCPFEEKPLRFLSGFPGNFDFLKSASRWSDFHQKSLRSRKKIEKNSSFFAKTQNGILRYSVCTGQNSVFSENSLPHGDPAPAHISSGSIPV